MAQRKSPAQLYSEISHINYSGAIAHYKNEKLRFYRELNDKASQTYSEAVDTFLTELTNELNNEPITAQEEDIAIFLQELTEEIRNRINGQMGNLKKYRKDIYSKYTTEIKKSNKLLSKAADELMEEQDVYDFMLQKLEEKYFMNDGNFSVEDLMNSFISYRNLVLRSLLNQGKNPGKTKIKQGYVRPGKGYLREAILHKAIYTTLGGMLDLKQVDLNKIAMATGSKKIDIIRGGKTYHVDTPFDEYISFLGSVEDCFNIDTLEEENVDIKGYGMQSKSWTAPWEQTGFKTLKDFDKYNYSLLRNSPYSVGTRAALKNQLSEQDQYSYSKSIQFLGITKNTITALGKQNVIYITGRNPYWTYDLIAKFRNMNYFLTFVFKNNEEGKSQASSEIRWDTPWRVSMAKEAMRIRRKKSAGNYNWNTRYTF